MENRRRLRCYVYDRQGQLRQMARICQNEDIHQVAIFRRNNNNLPNMNLYDNTRVCLNCYQSINNEIAMLQADPTCLKLNVLNQRRNRACALCNAENGLSRLSLQSRVNVFIRANIYVPEDVRFCPDHLNFRWINNTRIDTRITIDLPTISYTWPSDSSFS